MRLRNQNHPHFSTLPLSPELTTPQVRHAIRLLEGDALPQRTLAGWQYQGLVVPSIRWDRIRGVAHTCVWSLDDVVKVRLIVRLRRQGGLSMPKVRALLIAYESELRAALNPRSSWVLVVDRRLGVSLRSGDAQIDLPSQQYRLKLSALYEGAEKAVADVLRLAA